MVNIKKQIAISLKDIESKEKPSAYLEQYELDSETASRFLHNVLMHSNCEELLDAGCGSGSLTFASLLAGFERILAVDIDFEAIKKLKKNSEKLGLKWGVDMLVADFLKLSLSRKVDAIIMNPPFGTKRKHYDRDFLIKAFTLSDNVFSLHKKGNEKFFERLAQKYNFEMKTLESYKITIKHIMPFHKKMKHYVDVVQFYFKRNG